jgi:hypothetical protein
VSRLGIEPALEGMLTQVTADTTLRSTFIARGEPRTFASWNQLAERFDALLPTALCIGTM